MTTCVRPCADDRDGKLTVRSCSEAELRDIFSRFGQVQTCIVNKDKRHAFVKMYYRKDAERAKVAMEEMRSQEFQLRVSPFHPFHLSLPARR